MNASEVIDAAVKALDLLDVSDPEVAHSQADGVLLTLVEQEVAQAYKRVIERASWWASA